MTNSMDFKSNLIIFKYNKRFAIYKYSDNWIRIYNKNWGQDIYKNEDIINFISFLYEENIDFILSDNCSGTARFCFLSQKDLDKILIGEL